MMKVRSTYDRHRSFFDEDLSRPTKEHEFDVFSCGILIKEFEIFGFVAMKN